MKSSISRMAVSCIMCCASSQRNQKQSLRYTKPAGAIWRVFCFKAKIISAP
jgi:hypothetical protein